MADLEIALDRSTTYATRCEFSNMLRRAGLGVAYNTYTGTLHVSEPNKAPAECEDCGKKLGSCGCDEEESD